MHLSVIYANSNSYHSDMHYLQVLTLLMSLVLNSLFIELGWVGGNLILFLFIYMRGIIYFVNQ